MTTIKLGDRVRDIYTQFEGIATSRTEWLHGCDRVSINPTTLDKDGKVRERETFDDTRVELVERGAEGSAGRYNEATIINLGDRVKDVRTGFEGIACAKTEYLHDSPGITIEPTELSEDGKCRETLTVSLARIRLVKSQPVLVAAASETKKTGGPRPEIHRDR